MTETGKLRLAFMAGFMCRGNMDMVQHAENLKTMYGIDLEAEIMYAGFEQFTARLPELIKEIEES